MTTNNTTTLDTTTDVACNATSQNATSRHCAGAAHAYDVHQALLTTLGAAGSVANAIVIVVFAMNRKYRRKVKNKFIMNQVGMFKGYGRLGYAPKYVRVGFLCQGHARWACFNVWALGFCQTRSPSKSFLFIVST